MIQGLLSLFHHTPFGGVYKWGFESGGVTSMCSILHVMNLDLEHSWKYSNAVLRPTADIWHLPSSWKPTTGQPVECDLKDDLPSHGGSTSYLARKDVKCYLDSFSTILQSSASLSHFVHWLHHYSIPVLLISSLTFKLLALIISEVNSRMVSFKAFSQDFLEPLWHEWEEMKPIITPSWVYDHQNDLRLCFHNLYTHLPRLIAWQLLFLIPTK